ncbi:hypothetical protein DFH06DRAFT_1137971 [Mycena polygramma]|nr:hypothetical protein DFH06DRAFT_1137971 [Mycena polygramma]
MSDSLTVSTDAPELSTLIRSLQAIARSTRLAQNNLSDLLGRSVFEPVFVEHTPATPEEVAAAFASQNEAQSYWVVLRGREPGLYTTVVTDPPFTSGAANEQTNGVPNQHQLRVTGFAAALAYYTDNHPENVRKWVEEVVEEGTEEGGEAGSA